MFKNPFVYLILGLVLLLGAWSWQLFNTEYYTSHTYYAELVQSNLEKEVEELEYEMIPVLDSVSTTEFLEFKDYNLELKYPYFVFRNGELKIWSDYQFVPDYEVIAGEESLRIIENNNSSYLARKWFSDSPYGEFEVVSLIPLKVDYNVQNQYLGSNLNQDVFINQNASILLEEDLGANAIIIKESVLFWIVFKDGFELTNAPYKVILFIAYTIAIISLLLALFTWLKFKQGVSTGSHFLYMIITVWVLLKLALSVFNFPQNLIAVDIFDARFFAVSWFEQSFADMLLNTSAIFLISVTTFKYYRNEALPKITIRFNKLLVSSFVVFLLHLIINYQYLQLRTIYFNSQISLDITETFNFDSFRVRSLLIFILIGISSALYFHVFFKFLEGVATTLRARIIAVGLGTLFFTGFSLLVNLPSANLVIITVLVCVILFATGIHRSLQQESVALTLYVVLWIGVESLIGGWCIAEFEKTRDTNQMVRYAQSLASKNDYMAEFMIEEVITSVQNDPSISARLSNPFLSKEYIINKISKAYLNRYLDKYTTAIYLYGHSGEGLPDFGTTLDYHAIRSRYALEENKTEFDELFVLTQDIRSLSKHYMAFVPIKRYENIIGYIILDFRQKRIVPENVYPELLVDNRFRDYQNTEFSYAIFEKNYLIHSSGEMDYTSLDLNLMMSRNLWTQDGYRHYKLSDPGGDIIVVSKVDDFRSQLVSNTAFFIASMLIPIIFLLGWVLLRNIAKGREISYTAKIQLFLNLAFFLPLAVVTITTMSFITSSFREELLEGKIIDSHRLTRQIEQETDAFLVDVNAKDLLTDKLVELANYGNFDATIFGVTGQMITTTEPNIYSSGLQSGYLNHLAFEHLIEGTENNIVLDESIGTLDYYATYTTIRSRETNRLLGVLAIPFFRAQRTIESNQIEAFTTILNVFILIFLVALFATFQTSKWLTAPLLLIRERLGATSFSGSNQPIEWNSEDEIGKLISEYNNMLLKLESSREALARSQKESAWREVAQQVAHEIKNPLTPMKLTLQKLEREVSKTNSGENNQIEKTVKNLLNQLQMLNDIVTSFSEFAKMPMPVNEKVNIAEVLVDLKEFFDHEDHINLELQLHAPEVYISADKKLMSRIISNVIINAGQSKKEGQKQVDIAISTTQLKENGHIRISIEDNGTGIDPEVIERVFIPRFSTKEKGSGIGLAVAKHGIEHAGGTIWFETSLGVGTTFYLQLPEFL